MDGTEPLALATDEFAARLRAVQPDQWDDPTPCEGWTVRDLVSHVLGGNQMAVIMLAGASQEETTALLAGLPLRDDPVSQYLDGGAAQVRAFRDAPDPGQLVHHPIGDVPVAQVLEFRIGDLTIHTWDLARAIGADESLPDSLVERAWAGFEPMAPVIGSIGVFGAGPSGTVGEGAALQTRLLDLVGRRP